MLATLNDLLQPAKRHHYAVGAFNVPNLEAVRAVIAAAEELHSPVILQHAEVHESLISLEEIGPIMLDYAKRATVPVAVHLDHGASFAECIRAIRLGFTSIMYDASAKPYEQNVAETAELVKIAHSVGVSVEAELGKVFTSALGGGEGRAADSAEDYTDLDSVYTDPERAQAFVDYTHVDCLAIAFGTVHGVYVTKPTLDLNRITQVKNKIDIPLVMHGGSGVSEENYRIAIQNGITKINYYTYMNKAAGNGLKEVLHSQNQADEVFFDTLSLQATDFMKQNVKQAMTIFQNNDCH